MDQLPWNLLYEGVEIVHIDATKKQLEESPSLKMRGYYKGDLATFFCGRVLDDNSAPLRQLAWEKARRALYRIKTNRGARAWLVTKIDAFECPDSDGRRNFVIVYEGWTNITLNDLLYGDGRYKNIKKKLRVELRQPEVRIAFWRAMLNIAEGLHLLHRNQMIHGNLDLRTISLQMEVENDKEWLKRPEKIAMDTEIFERLRLNGAASRILFEDEYAPSPEDLESDELHNFATDWSAFGLCLARSFTIFPPENYGRNRRDNVNHAIELLKNASNLYESEREFIRSVLELGVTAQRSEIDILGRLRALIDSLERETHPRGNPVKPLPLCFNKYTLKDLWKKLRDDEDIDYDEARFRSAIPGLFRSSKWYLDRKGAFYFSPRQGLWLWGGNRGTNPNLLHCTLLQLNNVPAGFDSFISLPPKTINCVDSNSRLGDVYARWQSLIAETRRGAGERYAHKESEKLLLQSFELTNQMECLLASRQLFFCKVTEKTSDGKHIRLSLCQAQKSDLDERSQKMVSLQERISKLLGTEVEKLTEFLSRAIEQTTDEPDSTIKVESDFLLIITGEEQFGLSVSLGGHDSQDVAWGLDDIRDGSIRVHRTIKAPGETFFEGDTVCLRTKEHYGNMAVIERRQKAIKQMGMHDFLLDLLSNPKDALSTEPKGDVDFVYADDIDPNKREIQRNILKTKPLFLIQGPPGTGKSHTVRRLLLARCKQHPYCQILITARENSTVAGLYKKLSGDVSEIDDERQRPILMSWLDKSNKLNTNANRQENQDDDGIQLKAILDTSVRKLTTVQPGAPASEWRKVAEELRDSFNPRGKITDDALRLEKLSLRDLLRRSANLVFSTTSSQKLSDAVENWTIFDWAVVEEAGKTFSFDLALPFLAARRWILLGDHMQLRPFQYAEKLRFLCLDEEHIEETMQVEQTIQALQELQDCHKKNYKYVRLDFIGNNGENVADKEKLTVLTKDWLVAFQTMTATLRNLRLESDVDGEDVYFCNYLDTIYRLPPAIAWIIRETFYCDLDLKWETRENENSGMLPNASHRSPIISPDFLKNRSLVWIDTPIDDPYSTKNLENEGEAELIAKLVSKIRCAPDANKKPSLAILTPYRMQRKKLVDMFNRVQLEEKFERPEGQQHFIHTSDAFQGSEADIVIISLVKNNVERLDLSAIQFLIDPNRANVIFSRAVKVMIIVGSQRYFRMCLSGVDTSLFRDDPKSGAHFCIFLENFKRACAEYGEFVLHTYPSSIDRG